MSNLTYRQLLEAASFAARAHQGQYRKDRVTPYVSHPFRVCLVVRDLFGFDDPRMLITALLHDVIEDTTTDYDDAAAKGMVQDFPIGGGNPGAACQLILGCNSQYPLVSCRVASENEAGFDSIFNPGAATFLKALAAP